MKTMSAVNAVQLLFILVWTFSAVCRADDDISVSCENVTGTVREVTFNCSVSLALHKDCIKHCITLYKFYYTENNTDSTICRKVFPQDSCEQRNSFTCRFNSTMMEQFRFFIQTNCGVEETPFTVNITEPEKVVSEEITGNGLESKTTVIAAVMACFIFIIIIIMIIIYKKTPNYSKPCGFQRRIFLGHKHDDNNSNMEEQNPDNVI